MSKINLHENFIKSLHEKIPNKKELVDIVSDILRIEKEPASRRLNGRVLFSVQEMGILADELGIVIDSLLHPNKKFQWMPFQLESPFSADSVEDMGDILEQLLACMEEVTQKTVTLGSIFYMLPIELYVNHPHLMKFMFFKRGHYFVRTEEFNNFSDWALPEKFANLKKRVSKIKSKIENALYIWDESLIWKLVAEINYFHKLQVINTEDRDLIRDDLRAMLHQLEVCLRGKFRTGSAPNMNLDFYVSHINIGINSLYSFSEQKQMSFVQTSFSFSHTDSSYENCLKIKEWVDSFKKISVLISGSGGLERRLFFKKQHQIIDLFLE